MRSSPFIHWNAAGDGFVIPDVADFENNVLPIYYKHNRYSSFLRSLSYYSFLKNPHNEHVEYTHPCFRQGHPESLAQIVRKPTTSSRHPAPAVTGVKRPPPIVAPGAAGVKSPASPQVVRTSSRPRKRPREDNHDYIFGASDYGITLGDEDEGQEYSTNQRTKGSRKGYEYGQSSRESDEDATDYESDAQPVQASRARDRSESISGLANVLVAISGQTPMAHETFGSANGGSKVEPIRTRRPSIHVPTEPAVKDEEPRGSPIADALKEKLFDASLAELSVSASQYLPFIMTPQNGTASEQPSIHPAAVIGALMGYAAAKGGNGNGGGTTPLAAPPAGLTRSHSSESVTALIAGAQHAHSHRQHSTPMPLASPTVALSNRGDSMLPPPPTADERQISIDFFRSGTPSASPTVEAASSASTQPPMTVATAITTASIASTATVDSQVNASATNDSYVNLCVPVTVVNSVYKTFQALSAMSPSMASLTPALHQSANANANPVGAALEFLQAAVSPRAPAGPPLTSAFREVEGFKFVQPPLHATNGESGAGARPTQQA